MAIPPALVNAKLRLWKRDPITFVRENFKEEPDPWQKELLTVFPSQDPDKIRIALQACAGVGKSAGMAWCGLNFLSCYADRGNHPKGAVVSITGQNLKDNIWSEFAKWMNRSEFLTHYFKWTAEHIFARDHKETWFLSARSWPKTANDEERGRTLSGLHSKFVLVIFDESGDIPLSVGRSGEQAISSSDRIFVKLLQGGNPTSHSGMLYAAATVQRHLWHVIRITADPDDPNRSTRKSKEDAQEQIDLYGRDNPWVMAYILGLFPPSAINSLLAPEQVEAAMRRHVKSTDFSFAQKRLGVDVARFGDDSTVIFPRQGLVAFQPVQMRNASSDQVAARVMVAKKNWGSELEFIDATGGYGAGVVDFLRTAGLNPVEVQFAGSSGAPMFFNKRSEILWNAAEWVKHGGALPKIAQLVREMTGVTYSFQGGKLRVEEKDQIKKRLGFSPDFYDALACSFAWPDMPGVGAGMPDTGFGKMLHDKNPYA